MKLGDCPHFYLDLQTTGARPGSAHILEIGWGDDESLHSSLIEQAPDREIPFRIQQLTGIGPEDLAQARPQEEVLAEIREFARTRPYALIHFASFEKAFLQAAFAGEDIPFRIICTNEIARRLLPNLPTRGLKGLAGYFGFRCDEIKRAASHTEATRWIWHKLRDLLEEQGVRTLEDLEIWLDQTPKSKRLRYEYPLAKERRLCLPDAPGVYRMLSRWGEVLYVGKATSLKSRVNSYFRGQKNRDSRKLEMLTQVYDLNFTLCDSPLAAALLETDEIKRLDPPYNVSLKRGDRQVIFFDRHFTSSSTEQNETHPIGPFTSELILESVLRLAHSLDADLFDENIFFDPVPAELLKEGYEVFCRRHDFVRSSFRDIRVILSQGMKWIRHESQFEEEEPTSEPPGEVDELESELNAEDIADRFERHFKSAARAYRRSRKLTRLANADIRFKAASSKTFTHLTVRGGQLCSSLKESEINRADPLPPHWNIDTYDRMSVLLSELQRVEIQQGGVQVESLRTQSATQHNALCREEIFL